MKDLQLMGWCWYYGAKEERSEFFIVVDSIGSSASHVVGFPRQSRTRDPPATITIPASGM